MKKWTKEDLRQLLRKTTEDEEITEDDIFEKKKITADSLWQETPNRKAIERRFKKATRELENILEEIRLTFPDAIFYTGNSGSGICLTLCNPTYCNLRTKVALASMSSDVDVEGGDF